MDDIRFCVKNLKKHGEFTIKKIEDDVKNITTAVEECEEHCDECAKEPFAIVNGQYVGASSPEKLYNEILSAMNRDYELH